MNIAGVSDLREYVKPGATILTGVPVTGVGVASCKAASNLASEPILPKGLAPSVDRASMIFASVSSNIWDLGAVAISCKANPSNRDCITGDFNLGRPSFATILSLEKSYLPPCSV